MVIPRAKMPTLQYQSAQNIAGKIDKYMVDYLGDRTTYITNRPSFGVFGSLDDVSCKLIIKILILQQKLSYSHLLYLLPKTTTVLECSELLSYSPGCLNIINLVSERCPNYSKLHYHYSVGASNNIFYLEKLLHDSLLNLSKSVTEINLSNAAVSEESMGIISLYFVSLTSLVLQNTYMLPNAFDRLVSSETVFEDKLSHLIVDGTTISLNCAAAILTRFKNLGYFRCDSTIRTGHALLSNSETCQKTFNTKVLKQNFRSFCVDMDFDEVIKASQGLRNMFKKVNTLIFTSISDIAIPFVNHLIPVFNLVKLELSAFNVKRNYSFLELQVAFDSNQIRDHLISLTLEYFCNVDLYYLSEKCECLEILNLINNTYVDYETHKLLKLKYNTYVDDETHKLLKLKYNTYADDGKITYVDETEKVQNLTINTYADDGTEKNTHVDEKEEVLNLTNNTDVGNETHKVLFPNLNKLEVLFFSELLTKDERKTNFNISTDTLNLLLSAGSLERIIIREQDGFGKVLHDLLDSGKLRNLKVLSFYECLIEKDSLSKIFDHNIPIEVLEFTSAYVDENSIQRIKDIIKENNYATVLTVVTKTPYRQHNSFVDMPIFRKSGEMVCL